MIWDFEDGNTFAGIFSVTGFDHTVEEAAERISQEFPGTVLLPIDPLETYEKIHRTATKKLAGTARAKAAFLQSALRRIEHMETGVLLEISEQVLRVVIVKNCISILLDSERIAGQQEESVAARIAAALEGNYHSIIY